ATHERIHRGRFVRRWTDPDGAWCLRGPAEAGAVLNAVLEPLIDEVFRTARRDDRRESLEAYSFDALLALASGATVTTVPMAPGTEPAARAGDPSPATPDAPAHDPAPADRRGQGRPAG